MSTALQIFKNAGVDPRSITKVAFNPHVNFGTGYDDILNYGLKGGAIGAVGGGALEGLLGKGREGETGMDKTKRILGGAAKGGGLGALMGSGWASATGHLPTAALAKPEAPKVSDQIAKVIPPEVKKTLPPGSMQDFGKSFGQSHWAHDAAEKVVEHKPFPDTPYTPSTLATGVGAVQGIRGFAGAPDNTKTQLDEMMGRMGSSGVADGPDKDILKERFVKKTPGNAEEFSDPNKLKARVEQQTDRATELGGVMSKGDYERKARMEGLINKMQGANLGNHDSAAQREFLKRVASSGHFFDLPANHKELYAEALRNAPSNMNKAEYAYEQVYGNGRSVLTDIATKGGLTPDRNRAASAATEAVNDLIRNPAKQNAVEFGRDVGNRSYHGLKKGLIGGALTQAGTSTASSLLDHRKAGFGEHLNHAWSLNPKGDTSPDDVLSGMKSKYPNFNWDALKAPGSPKTPEPEQMGPNYEHYGPQPRR